MITGWLPCPRTRWSGRGAESVVLILLGGAQLCTTGPPPRPPSALTVGTTCGISLPSLCQEVRGGGGWSLLEKATCFIASAKKDGATAAARNNNSKTNALSRGTDTLDYSTVAGRITRNDVTTSNFLFMAVLQHERADDGRGHGVLVWNVLPAMDMASVCGYTGAKASSVRLRAHGIVEMMRWW